MDIDPATQAEQLQQIFYDLSKALDDFRLNNYFSLSDAQRQDLKQRSQVLFMRGQQCAADALGAILQRIQAHLPAIQGATKDAQHALVTVNTCAKVISIADSAIKLGLSIAAGQIEDVGGDLQGLQKAIGA
jgi:hypothetical protein